jgi:4,5-dihydroxyphthalate decarboxylase
MSSVPQPRTSTALRLKTLLGDHATTLALKEGKVASSRVTLDIADFPQAYLGFKRVVRDLEFDVAELAITTYLMAKAHGKPYTLLPVVVLSRFQHPFIVYNSARGELKPGGLKGKRVGIRSYSVTTTMWLRGVLMNDHALDINSVKWVTTEEAHVAEFKDPPTVERAPAGSDLLAMLMAGELDAIVLGDKTLKDPRLKRLIPDPDHAAKEWHARNRAIQINHMVVVKDSVSKSNPDAVREVYRLLKESKRAAPPAGMPDMTPIGLEANRHNLEVAIDYVHQQQLIPRRFKVDELFDDVTRSLDR